MAPPTMKRLVIYSGLALGILNMGIMASHHNWWPAPYYRHAFQAYTAQAEKTLRIQQSQTRQGGAKTVEPTTRMVNNDAAFTGYRFLCTKNTLSLINAQGNQKNDWNLPFSKVWPVPPHVMFPLPNTLVYCVSAHLYPNGDVLEVYQGAGDTPYGYGLVKMDKNSNVIWAYSKNTHHDVYVADDGSIYTLTQKFYDRGTTAQEFPEYPVLADSIAILNAQGKERDEINIADAFVSTPFEALFRQQTGLLTGKLRFDVTHANSVMPLEPRIADKFPMFKPGYILVSLKHTSLIAVIDPVARKVVWAAIGAWYWQHQAQFTADGRIMIFDNRGLEKNRFIRRSRMLAIDPATKNIVWEFGSKVRPSFFTGPKGSGQILPNGNILIVETEPGRLLEFTPDGSLAWLHKVDAHISFAQGVEESYFTKEFCRHIGCQQAGD